MKLSTLLPFFAGLIDLVDSLDAKIITDEGHLAETKQVIA